MYLKIILCINIMCDTIEKRGRKKKYNSEEEFLENRREACRIRKFLKFYETKYKIKLRPDQIEEAKKHRKTILQALPILDFLNSLEIIE